MHVIDELTRSFGLTADAAAVAVRTVVEGVSGAVDRAARDDLRAATGLAGPWRGARRASTVRGIQALLAHRLALAPGRAVELTSAVCASLARHLDGDVRARLHRDLPTDLAALFDAGSPAPRHLAPQGQRTGHTLADGRPGSSHPLSESRTGSSYPVSESRPR